MKVRRAKISDARHIVELYNELRRYELSLLMNDPTENALHSPRDVWSASHSIVRTECGAFRSSE